MINPFNDEQAKSIETRGVSILVSAPAGSGKTKILVSRIMSLLMEDHYSIDEFLVLTFTQAAAAEMKQRLVFAIEDELKKDLEPEMYAHLLKQKEKVPYAYITNFHGFCSQLLKKYGYLIGIEQGFDILSETTLLKHQVLDRCIEAWMQEADFIDFIKVYFNDMHFDAFKTMVLELYEWMHSIDNMDQVIKNIKESIYENYMNSDQQLDQWAIFPEIKRQLKNQAIIGYNRMIELGQFASEKGIHDFFERPEEQTKANAKLPVPYDTMYDYFKERLQLLNQAYFAYDHFQSVSLRPIEKVYSIKWEDDIKPYQKQFTSMKSNTLSPYIKKAEEYLVKDEYSFKMILKESHYVIDMLLGEKGLVKRFKEAYQLEKQKQHVLDFNDLEQYTIKLLQKEYGVSKLLYEQLKEIMIDEYQDTNQIQETIISLIKDYDEPSIIAFRVGDMKQSIYRFRQADPQLFKEKYDTYATNDQDAAVTKTRRIDLRFNYRSNKIVLDSVNYIFNQIMDTRVGGLEYLHDASSQLNYDYLRKEGCKSEAELPEKIKTVDHRYDLETRFDSEVLLIDDTTLKDLKGPEYEAHMVALKIRQLMRESTLNDFKGNHRKIKYKDIVVLMRSTSLFLTFKKVFDLYDIPNHIVLSQGYLNAVEIVSVITMLKAILYPYDDISLVSLLRGPYLFSHFSEDDLVRWRSYDQSKPFYDVLLEQREDARIYVFLETFETLQKDIFNQSPSEFLEALLDISGYHLFVGQLINGKQRQANLDLLVEEFRGLEKDHSIYEILNQYEELMKHQSSSSPAQMISSSDNVVQFMTIHKSKGLEFPIVFVSNMDKGFNKQDSTKRMILDKQLGIAIKPRVLKDIDLNEGEIVDQIVEYENPYRKLLASKQAEEAINEEMRIFYVALTRASQKLIMTGVGNLDMVKKWQEQILYNENPEIYEGKENAHHLLYYNARRANSYLDWVGLSLMRHPDIYTSWQNKELPEMYQELKKGFKQIAALKSTKQPFFDNTKASKFTLEFMDCEELEKELVLSYVKRDQKEKQVDFVFKPLPVYSDKEKAISVTKLQEEQGKTIIKTPSLVSKTRLSPTEKGTLVHAFFEYLPLDETPIDRVIETLYQEGLYNDIEKEVLLEYQPKIEAFIESEAYLRMKHCQSLYREKNFTLYDHEREQIVHGIFDVLCFDEDRITIIDYKTDRVKKTTPEYFLKENHRVQMEYYKLLLQRMYPNHHVEAFVYYLEIGKYVIL